MTRVDLRYPVTRLGIQALVLRLELPHGRLLDVFPIGHSRSSPLIQSLLIGILGPPGGDGLAGLLFGANDFGQGGDEPVDSKEDHARLFLRRCRSS